MSKLTTRLLTPEELRFWDDFVGKSERGLLFHTSSYLRHVGNFDVIGAFSGGVLQAAFPVPVVHDGSERKVQRSSYVSPYFSPVYDLREGQRVQNDRRARALVAAFVAHLQAHYTEVSLPLHPNLSDMVPFQHAHFSLELRYTYQLQLDSLERIWSELGDGVRNHIRKAAALTIEADHLLERFDFDRATFYEDHEQRARWAALVRELVAAGRGVALTASRGEAHVGGLFLAHYRGVAYNLLSYFDRGSPQSRGVAPRLLWAAIELARGLGNLTFDFEGSVLPSIESFFQGFGGDRVAYFQVHWHRDESRIRPVLYYYA